MFISDAEYCQNSGTNDTRFCSFCLKQLFVFNHIDEENDFYSALNGEYSSLTRAKNMCFKPFTQPDSKFLVNSEELDPENNFFINNNSMLADSSYISTLDLSSTMKNSTLCNLSLLHVNCRSLNKNFNTLTLLLDQLQYTIPVIAVTETWTTLLTEDDFQIAGYNFVAKSREHKTHVA